MDIRNTRLGALAGLALALFALGGVLLALSFGGRGGDASIVFASGRDGTSAIYVVGRSGRLVRLTSARRVAEHCPVCRFGDFDTHPAWSPDGRRIVFSRGAALHVIDSDGRGEVTIPTVAGAEDYNALWVPQADRVAFIRSRPVQFGYVNEIMLASADGSSVRRLVGPARLLYTDLFWSPDGRRLGFFRQITHFGLPGVGLFVADLSTGKVKRVLTAGDAAHGEWSPDGDSIVFAAKGTRFDPFRLYTLRLSTGAFRRLTSEPGYLTGDFEPHWSPDGRRIAFERLSHLTEPAIYAVDPSGRHEERLARGALDPAWSPDGKRIAFLSRPARASESPAISIMNADGSGRRTLAPLLASDPAVMGPLSWRPARRA